MFRVVDNADGTTSVFCKVSGKHIFTTPANQPRVPDRTSVNRPINVVGPSRQPDQSSRRELSDDPGKQDLSDQDLYRITSEGKCCISPLPVNIECDQTEDYFADSVTLDEFAKCLNLVPTKKMKNEPLTEILKEYPLRLLSRSKAYLSTKDSPEDLRFQKLPDDVPLSSKLGGKILNLNENRNFMNEQRLAIAIKKYDAFCRYPFNTPNPVECNFPKLRCREKKSYPTFSSKASKYEATHYYTYGRRQRLERMRTLKTGLNKESRQLLRLCNAKQCSVRLRKLSEEQIKYWLEKKSEPILVVIDDDDDDSTLFTTSKIVPSPSLHNIASYNVVINHTDLNQLNIKKEVIQQNINISQETPKSLSLLATTSTKISHLPNGSNRPSTYKQCSLPNLITLTDKKLARRRGCKEFHIHLTDVSQLIHKYKNNYFVKGTQICVPFYSNSLDTDTVAKKYPKVAARNRVVNQNYDCQTPTISRHSVEESRKQKIKKSQNKSKSQCLHQQSLQRSSSAPLQSRDGESSINALKIIPVVDLTGDSSPESNPNQYSVPKQYLVTQWLFRCFGCGFKRYFYNESNHCQVSDIVKTAINEHMKTYHFVENPDNFLSSYLDILNNCSIIEAFPGYKK